jgi:hypothetical protein
MDCRYSGNWTENSQFGIQNQVFLEDQGCVRGMLKNQGFACAVAGWVLEGPGFDTVAALPR